MKELLTQLLELSLQADYVRYSYAPFTRSATVCTQLQQMLINTDRVIYKLVLAALLAYRIISTYHCGVFP